MYLYWTMSKILLWHLSTSKWTQIIDWVGRWLFKTSWLYRIVTALTFDNWADFTELSQRWLLTSVSKVVTALTFQKSVCHSADFSKVSLSQRWLFKTTEKSALWQIWLFKTPDRACQKSALWQIVKSQRCDNSVKSALLQRLYHNVKVRNSQKTALERCHIVNFSFRELWFSISRRSTFGVLMQSSVITTLKSDRLEF